MNELTINDSRIRPLPKKTGHLKDLTGQRFGRLTATAYFFRDEKKNTRWECVCDCGNTSIVLSSHLRQGLIKSCGCLAKEYRKGFTLDRRAFVVHGETIGKTASIEYRTYCDAKQRCNNPRLANYKYYGGRGIEFRFSSFREFLLVVGRRPSDGYSLDRFPDNEGHYEPGNVRWATWKEQNNNKRR